MAKVYDTAKMEGRITKDIDTSKKWTTAEEKKALDDAITAAEEVVNDENATQKEIDDATQALKDATDTYNKAKKGGTKPAPQPPKLVAKKILVAKGIASGKRTVTISWNNVKANRYVIYMAKCNVKGKKYKFKRVKTVSGKTLKWKKSKLAKKTAYRFYVVAKKKSGSSYKKIAKSRVGYFFTGNVKGRYTNPKRLTLKRTAVTIKKGKTFILKGTVKRVKAKKRLATKYARLLRFTSNKPKVATVNAKGKITAKAKGTCIIYVQTINGIWKTCKVTVK